MLSAHGPQLLKPACPRAHPLHQENPLPWEAWALPAGDWAAPTHHSWGKTLTATKTVQPDTNNENFKKKRGIVKKNSRVRDIRVQRKERIPPPGGRARDFFRKSDLREILWSGDHLHPRSPGWAHTTHASHGGWNMDIRQSCSLEGEKICDLCRATTYNKGKTDELFSIWESNDSNRKWFQGSFKRKMKRKQSIRVNKVHLQKQEKRNLLIYGPSNL